MRIHDVETYVLRAKLDRPFGSSQRWVEGRSASLVRIVTESGHSGWGEAYGPRIPEAVSVLIQTALKPLIVEQDATRIEYLWHRMYSALRDSGQKGIAVAAISAIDVALWDLNARALGVPLHRLLGGPVRTKLNTYATGLYLPSSGDPVAAAVEEAAQYAEAGFRLIKLKGGLDGELDLARIRAVRDAVGNDVKIAFDVNHSLHPSAAIALGRQLETLDFCWFEEPVQPEDYDGYARIRAALDIPLAGGEAEYTSYGFRELVTRGCLDILQPDICSTGGFTEGRRVAALAHAWGLRCFPHVWGTSVALAAAAHFLAALPDPVASLDPEPVWLEFDQSTNPLRDQLAPLPFRLVDGLAELTEAPGLGVTIDPEALDRFLVPEYSYTAPSRRTERGTA
jgi:D-galactarolactone cycloisomerase